MDNIQALGCTIRETASLHAAITSEATKAYHAAIQQGKLSPQTPLCFRDIAFKDNLLPILDSYRKSPDTPLSISIDDRGNIVCQRADLESIPQPSKPG